MFSLDHPTKLLSRMYVVLVLGMMMVIMIFVTVMMVSMAVGSYYKQKKNNNNKQIIILKTIEFLKTLSHRRAKNLDEETICTLRCDS
jgi:uncharacterized membrane protein YesL